MTLSKQAKALAKDLELSGPDASLMELKARLYQKAANSIQNSKMTYEDIAKKVGISKGRVSRISKLGENNLSTELLVKVIKALG